MNQSQNLGQIFIPSARCLKTKPRWAKFQMNMAKGSLDMDPQKNVLPNHAILQYMMIDGHQL